jgi:hypothetical protein
MYCSPAFIIAIVYIVSLLLYPKYASHSRSCSTLSYWCGICALLGQMVDFHHLNKPSRPLTLTCLSRTQSARIPAQHRAPRIIEACPGPRHGYSFQRAGTTGATGVSHYPAWPTAPVPAGTCLSCAYSLRGFCAPR